MPDVAVITARGGSKRIPRKNIRLFRGRPIIGYSIQTAIASGLFGMVMVSTDDEEIAEVATQYGAKVPFLRSTLNADDHAGTADVMLEVLKQLEENKMQFEHACCIYPTAPLISVENLFKGRNLMVSKKFDTVFPVCAFSYPVQRALQINNEGKAALIWPENLKKRSQDLMPAYHDAGQFYWMNVEGFFENKNLFVNNSGGIILSELEVQDIDNETDWKLAEIKHSLLFPDV